METKHESPGKLQKTAPPLPFQARLLSKHCTFHPRGLEPRGGGGWGSGGGATSCFSRRRIHKHRVQRFLAGTLLWAGSMVYEYGRCTRDHPLFHCWPRHTVWAEGNATRACECSLSLRISHLYSMTDSLSGSASSQTNRGVSAARS